MGFLYADESAAQVFNLNSVVLTALLAAAVCRILYVQFLHPLSGFNGPWYASSSSLFIAILSVLNREPEWLMYIIRKYGGEFPDTCSSVVY
jgi:hypothetical protein